MRYWHLTEASRLRTIRKSGLQPGKRRLFGEGMQDGPSHFKDRVWVSDSPKNAIAHMARCVLLSGIKSRPWILVEVDLPSKAIELDEYGYEYIPKGIPPSWIVGFIHLPKYTLGELKTLLQDSTEENIDYILAMRPEPELRELVVEEEVSKEMKRLER